MRPLTRSNGPRLPLIFCVIVLSYALVTQQALLLSPPMYQLPSDSVALCLPSRNQRLHCRHLLFCLCQLLAAFQAAAKFVLQRSPEGRRQTVGRRPRPFFLPALCSSHP